jgi:hypothetical protein
VENIKRMTPAVQPNQEEMKDVRLKWERPRLSPLGVADGTMKIGGGDETTEFSAYGPS